MTEKFWMVSVTGGGPSSVRHEKKEDAIAEAKRLALKTNTRVYVLEAITAYEMPPITLIEIDLGSPQNRHQTKAPRSGKKRDPLNVTFDPYGAQITPQQD